MRIIQVGVLTHKLLPRSARSEHYHSTMESGLLVGSHLNTSLNPHSFTRKVHLRFHPEPVTGGLDAVGDVT